MHSVAWSAFPSFLTALAAEQQRTRRALHPTSAAAAQQQWRLGEQLLEEGREARLLHGNGGVQWNRGVGESVDSRQAPEKARGFEWARRLRSWLKTGN